MFGGNSSNSQSDPDVMGEDDGFDEDGVMAEMSDEDDEFDSPDLEPDLEEEQMEWDTAYQCFDELIQMQGFSGAKEFIAKYMAYEVKNAPEFRDRIARGRETANMIRESVESIESLQHKDESMSEMGELASRFEEANRLKQSVAEFTDKEDEILAHGAILGHKALDILSTRSTSGSGSGPSVSGRVKKSDREI